MVNNDADQSRGLARLSRDEMRQTRHRAAQEKSLPSGVGTAKILPIRALVPAGALNPGVLVGPA